MGFLLISEEVDVLVIKSGLRSYLSLAAEGIDLGKKILGTIGIEFCEVEL